MIKMSEDHDGKNIIDTFAVVHGGNSRATGFGTDTFAYPNDIWSVYIGTLVLANLQLWRVFHVLSTNIVDNHDVTSLTVVQ